ncbi:Fic family protein [Salibacteraceae bacterium]|nr:Fic family protein [Salibacteraceae bacterium]
MVFKKLSEILSENEKVALVTQERTGIYSRKIWFLLEWASNEELPIQDLSSGNFINVIDDSLQYALSKGENSSRHRVINNLPGTPAFCPLVRKTEKLKALQDKDLSKKKNTYLNSVHKSVLQRASTFLLLKDSKASFSIEGESPKSKRAARWGQAIGQAGMQDLDEKELLRLQQQVIENSRFITMGFRTDGGFVGEHDRETGEPLPDHISARWQDLDALIDGLLQTSKKLEMDEIDAVVAAATIAFGFVFIHPYADGNGRIHRYLIHHILARKGFAQQGVIFPVSAAILERIDDYRKVLESYSHPLLDLVEWRSTKNHNVEVLNETADLYRYFDATSQAEFLYECVEETLEKIIPEEVNYLRKYDEFKQFIDEEFEMPDKLVASLCRYLEQNGGALSQKRRQMEFSALSDQEVVAIENEYQMIFEIES